MTGLLVIGANGQVGWDVNRQACAAGLSCLALSRAQLDITNRDLVFRTVEQVRPTCVVNAAAYTAVDKAEDDAETAYAVNRDGAKSLAAACAAVGASLIHISTDYVFDGEKSAPYKEDDAVAPLGVYGASKLAGEEAVRGHCSEHIILRTSWVYGRHGHNFVRTMLRLGRERDSLRVVDDQFGSPTFAGDLSAAILKLVSDLRCGAWPDGGFGTFHCAGHGITTWCEFARAIFRRAPSPPVIEAIGTVEYPTPAKRPRNSALDCTKLAHVHGIVLRPWETALEAILDDLTKPPASRETSKPFKERASQ